MRVRQLFLLKIQEDRSITAPLYECGNTIFSARKKKKSRRRPSDDEQFHPLKINCDSWRVQLVLRPPCHVFPQQTRPHNIACGRKHFFARETGGQSRQRTLQEFFEDHCRPVTRSFSILFTCCCKLLRGSLCYIGQKVFFSSDIVIVINNRRKNEWNSYTRSIVTQRVEHFWCSKKMINHFM